MHRHSQNRLPTARRRSQGPVTCTRGYLYSATICSLLLCLVFLPRCVDAQTGTTPAAERAKEESDTRTLEPGQVLQREIAGGQSHFYKVKVAAGQFLRVSIEQQGADVVAELFGPGGTLLTTIDTPDLSRGPESVSLIADSAGVYLIKVRTFAAEAAAGRYEVRIGDLRPAVSEDALRVAAERAFAEGEALRTQWRAETLRQAIEKYQKALRLWRSLKDLRGEGTTLNILGLVYDYLGDRRRALDYFEQALPARRAAGDSAGTLQTLNNIGVAYSVFDQREKALEYFKQALPLSREVGDSLIEAFLHDNVGHVYLSLGQLHKAVESFQSALALNRVTGNQRKLANTLSSLGGAYASLGEDEKALEYYQQAVAIWGRLGIRRDEVSTLTGIASVYLGRGDGAKAAETFNQMLPLLNDVDDVLVRAGAASGVAWMYVQAGRHKEAQALYERVLAGMRVGGMPSGEAWALVGLSLAHYGQGEQQRAVNDLMDALVIMRQADDPVGEGVVLSSLMYVWQALGRPRLAIYYGKRAVNRIQELRANIQGLEKRLQKSFLKDKAEVYKQLAEILIGERRLLEAQQVLDMLKEEEYFDFVRRDGQAASALSSRMHLLPEESQRAQKDDDLIGRIVALGREREVLRQKSPLTPEEERRLAEVETELEKAGRDFQQFRASLEQEFASKSAGREKVYQLGELQGLMNTLRELGDNSVALYTIIGAEKYRVILITPETQVVAEYAIKADELYHKILGFRRVLQNPEIDPRPRAQELYRILIGPIEKGLAEAHAETLMWELDGPLRYVPVSALHDGERYMVEKYRNVVFTPASRDNLKDKPTTQWKGFGFGVSKAQQGFSALRTVPAELQGIIYDEAGRATAQGVLPGKVFLDGDFTLDALKSSLRRRYPVVHIASHFSFKPGDETNSFLLLGDGTHLSLDAIKASTNFFPGVELLTLSACDTVSSELSADGKEIEGFGVLAQRQGAKAVVASLWAVADTSTSLLMQNFYRLRSTRPNLSKVEALRQAQLTLLRGEAGGTQPPPAAQKSGGDASEPKYVFNIKAPYSHPYFWSPFILLGNWR
jgi:CHAT domain-containing protein/Tfp pilus assembly protein PilF/uncharacterized protein YoaH (UPF0181 family)